MALTRAPFRKPGSLRDKVGVSSTQKERNKEKKGRLGKVNRSFLIREVLERTAAVPYRDFRKNCDSVICSPTDVFQALFQTGVTKMCIRCAITCCGGRSTGQMEQDCLRNSPCACARNILNMDVWKIGRDEGCESFTHKRIVIGTVYCADIDLPIMCGDGSIDNQSRMVREAGVCPGVCSDFFFVFCRHTARAPSTAWTHTGGVQ